MANLDPSSARPLSPHLSIYKPIPTMVMSVFHRMTGAILYFGTLFLAWWLIAAASGEAYFEWVNYLFGTIIGRLVLFGYTWSLVHHMIGGLRHLIWDTGRALGKEAATKMAFLTIGSSITITLILWVIGYMVR